MAMPKQLERSYLSGKVAPRIRWGTGGDFTRCVRQARKHGMSDGVAKGACAKLHKRATGMWPGDKRNLKSTQGRRKR
jgi:hypothetical protein